MSVVIVGGNECMTRQYIDLCKEYKCKAKVYAKKSGGLKNFGSPDLLVLFTDTLSHKTLKNALDETKNTDVKIAYSNNSSKSALKKILEQHAV